MTESLARHGQEALRCSAVRSISPRSCLARAGYVVVSKGSQSAADPGAMQLCQFPAYPEVPAGSIQPGESVRVSSGDLGGLDDAGGEFALYVEPSYTDPAAVAGYVQWGSAGHKREGPAVAGGVRAADSFVDAKGRSSMKASGPDAASVGAWTVS